MATSTNVDIILNAKDNASSTLKSVGRSAESTGDKIAGSFRTGAIAATGFIAAVTGVGIAMIKTASDFEQNNIAFETMLGSAEKGRKVLADLSNFAVRTPFELPQLMTASKSLLAYGVEARDLIPTLKSLGDIASGVGMDKLPNLILAFGQVKAATKLTGMELRQFTEAGVPLLEVLSKQMGKTVSEIKDMISEGTIGFPEVEKAIKSMSEKGGKFFNLMEKQAGTFGGMISNIKDQVTRSLAEIAGVDIQAGGLIREGSLFFVMKELAEGLLKVLNKGTPIIVKWTQQLAKNKVVVAALAGALAGALAVAIGGLLLLLGPALIVLAKFMLIGAAIGVVVGGLITAFNKLGINIDTIRGKFGPLVDLISEKIERVKQILEGFGINLEFGNLIKAFQNLEERVTFYTLRILQIIGEAWQKMKNFLAFGGFEGDATIVQALEGIWNRIKPIKEGLEPLFAQIYANLQLTGEIIKTQVVPAFQALIDVLGPLWESLKPIITPAIVDALKLIATAIGLILVTILAVITGFASALANALPYIAQALEGAIQFIRGFVQLVTALLNGDWRLALEGMMQMAKGAIDFVVNTFEAMYKFISGFIKGVIDFFMALYNALVGQSIIPDLVARAMELFNMMGLNILKSVVSLVSNVIKQFNELKEKVESVVNAIASLISNFNPVIKIGLQLPDIEGAWNSLKARARNIGVPGFQTGGIVPGPIGAPVLAQVHGGEEIKPFGRTGSSGGGGGGVTLNVYVGMYAGTDTEKRTVAKDLYGALLQLAQSQHKTVQEFMGG